MDDLALHTVQLSLPEGAFGQREADPTQGLNLEIRVFRGCPKKGNQRLDGFVGGTVPFLGFL